jgi:hypothetical protein
MFCCICLYQLINVHGRGGRAAASSPRELAALPLCRCTFAARAEYTQADCHFYLD